MSAASLIPTYCTAKYFRMALNPVKDYERYCRVSAVEEELSNIIDKEIDFSAIP